MRLWHKDMIPYLPGKQLVSQWRECCCIAKNISINGTPNHLLVNKIMNYPLSNFYAYTREVATEMWKRGYKCDFDKFEQYITSCVMIPHNEIFEHWHNDRYFRQCYYNLQEKYDCGGISDEEWDLIS